MQASACMCVPMFVSDYKTEREVLWDIWGDVKKIWDILFNGI